MNPLHFLQTVLVAPACRHDTSTLQAWRERVLSANLFILASLGTVGYLVFLISDIRRGMEDPSYWREIPVNTVVYLMLMAVALIRRLPFAVRAGFMIFALYAAALSDKFAAGLGGIGELLLITLSALLVIFFGWKGGLLAVLLDIAAFAIPGWLMTTGQIPLPAREAALSADPATWAITAFVVLMMSAMLMISAAILLEAAKQRG